jgi:quercetin dioxygenase-like cupin family protein
MKLKNLAFTLLATCLLTCPLGTAYGAENAIKVEPLMQTTTSWDGAQYKQYPAGQPQLSIVRVTIPPHTEMPWHTHPIPNAGYLVSGELTVERQDGSAKKHYVAGQTIAETVDTVHRGVTGDSEAVIIVFYAGANGLPLSQPTKSK